MLGAVLGAGEDGERAGHRLCPVARQPSTSRVLIKSSGKQMRNVLAAVVSQGEEGARCWGPSSEELGNSQQKLTGPVVLQWG